VRYPEYSPFPPKVLNNGRPYTYQIKYPDRADCDQGARQSPHRAYACSSPLPHEKAQVQWPWPCSVRLSNRRHSRLSEIDLCVASYVDHQLRTSRRFDAAGLARHHPELFHPFPRRRSSSSNSVSSNSTASSSKDDLTHEEGQLRYWTADMCSHSPHLFDFVITVRYLILYFSNLN
jgi:hypothetical protein